MPTDPPVNQVEIVLDFTGNADDFQLFKGQLQDLFEDNPLVINWRVLATPKL